MILGAVLMPADLQASNAGLTEPISGQPQVIEVIPMKITAYSSTVDQTDSTPFITASGMHVRDGIVATNMLPFGTQIEIPLLFGDKIFTVEDRMSARMKNVVDIWMATTSAAIRFGVNHTDIFVVSRPALSER